MDYRAKIIELLYKVESEKILRFIFYMLEDAISRYDISSLGEGLSK